MIKALLCDADGMVIKQHRYFAEICSEKYGLPLEKIAPYFRGPFRDCQMGKADLKETIANYLIDWGYPGSVDDYLKEWFQTDVVPDTKVLNVIQNLRQNGLKCYLATDQEKYRAEFIAKNTDLKNYFDDFFYSYQLGYRKLDSKFFQTTLKRLNLKPEEVQFWDDEEENVAAAKQVGIEAHLFKSIKNFKQVLGL